MALLNIYAVEFSIKKASAGGAGTADQYRRDVRKALVSAASAHPKDILTVLNADIAPQGGEVIDILSVQATHVGTEGSAVLA